MPNKVCVLFINLREISQVIRIHFRTKKRQEKNTNRQAEVLPEERIRSIKNTVSFLINYCKTLSQSTFTGVEEKKKYLLCLSSVDYISLEHLMSEDNSAWGNSSSEDEDAPKRKVLCRRPLQWRSMELNSLFSRLDRIVHKNSLNVVPL